MHHVHDILEPRAPRKDQLFIPFNKIDGWISSHDKDGPMKLARRERELRKTSLATREPIHTESPTNNFTTTTTPTTPTASITLSVKPTPLFTGSIAPTSPIAKLEPAVSTLFAHSIPYRYPFIFEPVTFGDSDKRNDRANPVAASPQGSDSVHFV